MLLEPARACGVSVGRQEDLRFLVVSLDTVHQLSEGTQVEEMLCNMFALALINPLSDVQLGAEGN